MLAGLGKIVDPNTRKEIEEGAKAFASNVPYRTMSPDQIATALKKKPHKSVSVRTPPPRRKPAAKTAMRKSPRKTTS